MYGFTVSVHNILRWVVLILGILITVWGFWGWLGKKEWNDLPKRIGLFYTVSVDIQLLVGFLLYFVFSDWALAAILDKGMSYVMGQHEYRFFAIEHVFYMVVAMVFAHLGSALSKKADNSQTKFKRAAIWYGLSLLIILAGIPWWRPLFP